MASRPGGGEHFLVPIAPPTSHVLSSLLAVAVAVLVAPPAAQAAFTKHEAARSVDEAVSYWRQLRPALVRASSPECRTGRVRIDWKRNMGDSMASAPIRGCREGRAVITLEHPTLRDLADYHGCAVITHELGHLLGMGHVQRNAALMSGARFPGARPPQQATWERAWGRCRRAL